MKTKSLRQIIVHSAEMEQQLSGNKSFFVAPKNWEIQCRDEIVFREQCVESSAKTGRMTLCKVTTVDMSKDLGANVVIGFKVLTSGHEHGGIR